MVRKLLVLGLVLALPAAAAAAPPRERAIEQIPELMGRILESQEEIREQESRLGPRIELWNEQLERARGKIEQASSEDEAAVGLVDYVEAYAERLEEQQAGLDAIEPSIVRMRADARDLIAAAEAVGVERETPEDRRAFYQDQFQGVASATGELATRLERETEASTTGAVLHASWASHAALDVPIDELGPEGAVEFARKVEGLYARYQARSGQLGAERRSVRRLLDVLIERQLAQRLDTLFAGGDGVGLGALLNGDGTSQDWQDLGGLVRRTLGLPSSAGAGGGLNRETASLDRLDFFANGGHRD